MTRHRMFVVALLFCAAGITHLTPLRAQTGNVNRVVLDCDTANEIDDFYAIARMVRQDKAKVLCLSSAQWVHYLGERDSVGGSQRDNEEILSVMGITDLPTPKGSAEPMGKPWGGTDAKDSAAAQFIIDAAMKTPDGKKLSVICTGASTNLASAIKLSPKIAPRIRAYILGFQYDVERKVWNKSEFNIRRDLNAADFLLDQSDLELHVMPTSVSGQLKFDQSDSFDRQSRMGKLGQLLTEKWTARFLDSKRWTMWDVALVEAFLDPSVATEAQVKTPPENTPRNVWMYTDIDEVEMQRRFWEAVQSSKATF